MHGCISRATYCKLALEAVGGGNKRWDGLTNNERTVGCGQRVGRALTMIPALLTRASILV
jgi:hypothetical protein